VRALRWASRGRPSRDPEFIRSGSRLAIWLRGGFRPAFCTGVDGPIGSADAGSVVLAATVASSRLVVGGVATGTGGALGLAGAAAICGLSVAEARLPGLCALRTTHFPSM
jgi:hypothetical protein